MREEWAAYEKVWRAKFEENLRELTKDHSIAELSRGTGIASRSLSNYITGRLCPSVWNCVRIARYLGIPITDIIDYFY